MAVANNTRLDQRLFPKKKPLAVPNITLDQFSGKTAAGTGPATPAVIPAGTQTPELTTFADQGGDFTPAGSGVAGTGIKITGGGVTDIPPPSTRPPLPELPEPVSPDDFRFEQSITPDLQEIKQHEALTGREISAQAIEGLTRGQLEEATRNAMQARQLNIQQANIETQQGLDLLYAGLAIRGESRAEEQFYQDNFAPDEGEEFDQQEITIIQKDISDSSIDYNAITQNPSGSIASKNIDIDRLNSDINLLVGQLREQGIEVDWEPYARLDESGNPIAAGTAEDQTTAGQAGEVGAVQSIPQAFKDRGVSSDNPGSEDSVVLIGGKLHLIVGEHEMPGGQKFPKYMDESGNVLSLEETANLFSAGNVQPEAVFFGEDGRLRATSQFT